MDLVNILQTGLLAYLVIGMPLFGRRNIQRLKQADDISKFRVRLYRKTIIHTWVLTLIALILMLAGGESLSSLGFNTFELSSTDTFIVVGIIIIKIISLIVLLLTIPYIVRTLPKTKSYDRFQHLTRNLILLPETRKERTLWFFIAITAGVCEETIYRGFARVFLHNFISQTTIVLLLIAVVFGFGHWYQGWHGILATTILGAVFGWLFQMTGSLWVPILVHTLIDLTWVFLKPHKLIHLISVQKT